MQIPIVYENENFVVAKKPALMLSVPAREATDPRPVLGKILEIQLKQQIFPVHRLDYEVSGLILFAKTKEAHKIANKWFEEKSIFKIYQAITESGEKNFEENQKLVWKSKLVRGKKRTFEADHGQMSETHAWQTKSFRIEGLPVREWRLAPITGKSHQLRFEMYKHGCPIIGDKLYGSKYDHKEGGIALKAIEIDLSSIADRFGLPEKISLASV